MATQSTTAFSVLLRQHRVASGLTQEALAERAGLSVYGIQKLEAGTTHPYRDTAQRLVRALELAPDAAAQLESAVEPVRRHGSARREPAVERRHNLPDTVTSFVGREQELVELPPRLRAGRLLTLTGAGGSGKTRLAIEMARRQIDAYRDGVWLIELAQIDDAALVPYRLGAVLDVHETSDRAMPQALAEALRGTRTLLVLDNCEHLLDACATLVDLLLRECPTLHVLATSREPLGIPAEVSRVIPSLPAPAEHVSDSVAEVERSPAARLFVDRASALQPDFALGVENAHAIAQICRRLDGIPLALELAAACLDAFTPHQLASRLDQRFRLLTDGNRTALPRQQTLRATVDWSYQLLSDAQQRVFERLSVFASGWTLEASELVCAGDGVEAGDVLQAVRQLVRKSLVVRTEARYGVPETLREYALEKLRLRDGELDTLRERHAKYYSELVLRLDPAAPTTLLPSSGDGQALTTPLWETLDDVHDNVRNALTWWLDTRRATDAMVLLRALCQLWLVRRIPVDARRWFEAVLDLVADTASDSDDVVAPALHAQVLLYAGATALSQGQTEAARRFSQSSVDLWRSVADEPGLAQALNGLGTTLGIVGSLEEARAVLREGLAHARAGGNAFILAQSLLNLGMVTLRSRQFEPATALLRESEAVAQTIERAGDRAWLLAGARTALGRAQFLRGEPRDAAHLLTEALKLMRESGIAGARLGACLDWIAEVLAETGDPLRATTLFGAADAVYRTSGFRRTPPMQLGYERGVRAVQAELDEQAFADALANGRAMTAAQAIAYALDAT